METRLLQSSSHAGASRSRWSVEQSSIKPSSRGSSPMPLRGIQARPRKAQALRFVSCCLRCLRREHPFAPAAGRPLLAIHEHFIGATKRQRNLCSRSKPPASVCWSHSHTDVDVTGSTCAASPATRASSAWLFESWAALTRPASSQTLTHVPLYGQKLSAARFREGRGCVGHSRASTCGLVTSNKRDDCADLDRGSLGTRNHGVSGGDMHVSSNFVEIRNGHKTTCATCHE